MMFGDVKIFVYLLIQFASGLTPMGNVARRTMTIPYIKQGLTGKEIIPVIDVVRTVMASEITGVKLVTKTVKTVMGPYTRKEEKEETIEVRELLAEEGIQESASAASTQMQRVQSSPAVLAEDSAAGVPDSIRDLQPLSRGDAARHGIDFQGLSNNTMTNREAQPFGAGAMQIQGLEKWNILNLHDLMHRSPLEGTTAEVGYVPLISAADAPLYGLPPLPPGGL